MYLSSKNERSYMTELKEKVRFIKLCSDTTFKYLYKNPKLKPWFDEIILEKCGLDLSGFELVDNETNTGNQIKDYRMDLVLKKEDTIVIIEMNDSYYQHLRIKNYSYLYRIAGNRFETGENYHPMETKLILFNNYSYQKNSKVKEVHYLLMEPHLQDVIEDIESFEIYLPEFKDLCYDNNEIDIRLSLFQKESYEEMRKATKNSRDLEIIEELERLAMDEEFIYAYDHEAVRKKEENSIRKDSYEEGIAQEKMEIAKSMLKGKEPIEKISQYTGLSLSEIQKLKEKEC